MIGRLLLLVFFLNFPNSDKSSTSDLPKPSEVNKLITNLNRDIQRLNSKIDSLLLTRGCILGDSCEVRDIK